jgi:uncharacterized protein
VVDEKSVAHISVVLGTAVPDGQWLSLSVDRDLDQPDMATVVVTNTDHSYSKKCQPGQKFEIEIKGGEKLFQGEIVGIEPVYQGKGKHTLVVRGFNKLHLLLRGRASKTYNKKNDKQIISEVLSKHGLSLEWEGPEITHDVVYQHNQTDLEFVRLRAARLGLRLSCVDTKVTARRPKLDQAPDAKYSVDKGVEGAEQLRSFMPRLSSAPVVKKVTVKGWDEEKKKLITGEAVPEGSKLGSSQSDKAADTHGKAETFTVDQPIRSIEEAKELAKGRLIELSLSYMSGELEVLGNGKIEPGKIVQVTVNKEDDKFNGKYFVTGVSHRFTPDSHGTDGGFVTTARLQRDAQGAAAEKAK